MSKRRLPTLHLAMFIVTFLTMLLAGAMLDGINPLTEPLKIFSGLPFALSLMCILLTHELSHYFSSRYHGVEATLPFFIPAPTIIGTFGAFIKMRSPIYSKRALVDIGASGPIAGFVVALIASFIGLEMSEIVQLKEETEGLYLGSSILFQFLSNITIGQVPEGHDVLLNPVAFAGWVGFLVTALNLIPVGQLDGGHVAYALLGRKHRQFSMALVLVLFIMGIALWPGWLIWAILLIILGIDHPPILYEHIALDGKR
ncbi:MAG: site-2 protease family protein, partial [Nitrospirota bacterium]